MARGALLPGWAKAWRADFSYIAIWHVCMRKAREKYSHRHKAWHDDPRPRQALPLTERRARIAEICNVVAHSNSMSSLTAEEWGMLGEWHMVAEHRTFQMPQIIQLLSGEAFDTVGDAGLFLPAYALSEIDRDEQEVLERMRDMLSNLKSQNSQYYRRALHILLALGEPNTDIRIQHNLGGHPTVGLGSDFESQLPKAPKSA